MLEAHLQYGLDTHLLAISDIASIMQTVFDAPMLLLQGQKTRGIGFLSW